MFINFLFSKIWQKIFPILPSFRQTCNTVVKFRKLRQQYGKFSPNKPVLLFLTGAFNVQNNGPTNLVTQYDVEENLSHLMTLARLALEKGDTERATAILEMGIKISEEYEVYVALPYMYDILAAISFAQGNMEKAEHLLVSAIEKIIQIGIPDNDSQVVDFQLRLARIYSAYEKNIMAEIGFLDCLNKQKQKILNGDTSTKTGMLYVNVLFWYGLHKIRCKEFKIAKGFITNAYDYSMKIKGLSPYQEMVILYTLADLHMQLGENNMALQNMNSAILLGKGIGSTDMPRCYLKLAQIYLNLGALKIAKETCEEAIKLGSLFKDTAVVGEAEYTLQKIQRSLKQK